MAWLHRPDGRIYYEHYAAAGTCVVLSHGFGMGCRVWDNTIARLQDAGYAVLAYDHRGCGRSDKDFADVSISALGDDLAALCEIQGDRPVVLNGWSLGGAVVVDAAAKMPGRVAGLISTCGATPRYTQAQGFPHGGQAEDVAATVAALRADRVNFLKGLYFEGVFAAAVSEDVKDWCYRIALQASSAADASLGALAQLDQRQELAGLQVPCLFVTGEEDGVVPPGIGEFAAGHAARGTLAPVKGCGHAPFLEAPDEYHQVVLDFLQNISQ